MSATPALLEVEDLVVRYPIHRGFVGTAARRPRRNVHAVEGVSLSLRRREMLALVGESGCGKTTTAQAVLRLVDPVSGSIRFDGRDLVPLGPRELRPLRRRIQVVYQDPYESLDPRFRVRAAVEEPLLIHGLGGSKSERAARVRDALVRVELSPPELYLDRYPHELSGGQRQRVGVARALAADPPVLLMDEPFGAIDPIARDRLQAEFLRLQDELEKTVVFVTHDVDEAVRLGDRIAVLRDGGVLQQYDTPAKVLGRPATDFVADFVGGDRGLKRLSVTPIDASGLKPPHGELPFVGEMAAKVPVGATLKDALAQLLLHDARYVAVMDGDRSLGVLTADDLHGELRKSLAEDGQ
jgi:osmoprotectant transport system ATP-binding protein